MADSILFDDIDTTKSGVPSLFITVHKKQGEYVGEGKIEGKLKNGKYKVRIANGTVIQCTSLHSTGETMYPTGIPVIVYTNNADGYILGRVRPVKDENQSDGKVETDESDVIGNPGDAMLQPHSTKEEGNNARVIVTAGGVVKIRASSGCQTSYYPSTGQKLDRCESLLAYSDAYRIESGRKAGKKGGVVYKASTKEEYVDAVGPVRNRVKVENGDVGSNKHEFSVSSIATTAGTTSGLTNFKWEIDGSGNWTISHCKTLSVKGLGPSEPVVLGKQYVALQKALILDQTAINAANIAAMSTLTPLLSTALTLTLALPFTSIGNFFGLMILYPSLIGMTAAFSALYTASTTNLTAQQLLYLTPIPGVTNELVLSDYFTSTKLPALPGVVLE